MPAMQPIFQELFKIAKNATADFNNFFGQLTFEVSRLLGTRQMLVVGLGLSKSKQGLLMVKEAQRAISRRNALENNRSPTNLAQKETKGRKATQMQSTYMHLFSITC